MTMASKFHLSFQCLSKVNTHKSRICARERVNFRTHSLIIDDRDLRVSEQEKEEKELFEFCVD